MRRRQMVLYNIYFGGINFRIATKVRIEKQSKVLKHTQTHTKHNNILWGYKKKHRKRETDIFFG